MVRSPRFSPQGWELRQSLEAESGMEGACSRVHLLVVGQSWYGNLLNVRVREKQGPTLRGKRA